jgi:hypothetical protein
VTSCALTVRYSELGDCRRYLKLPSERTIMLHSIIPVKRSRLTLWDPKAVPLLQFACMCVYRRCCDDENELLWCKPACVYVCP